MVTSLQHHRIEGIHRIALFVPELTSAHRFYRDIWLLSDEGRDGGFQAFRSRGEDHDDLLIGEGPSQIAHVALRVASVDALDALATLLDAAGFSARQVPQEDLLRGDAAALVVDDPDGREIWLVVPGPTSASAPASAPALAPQRIGHVVLWTPAQEEAERFYTLLGFQVSDRTNAGMSFLRCNADHHSLALMKSEHGRTGLQHVAYDVGSLDNVMRNFGRLRALGVECVWGVGRHGPGNNVFSYYTDPAGNYIEYYGDMEKCGPDEPVETKIWGPEHKGDAWGIAGMPPLGFRE